MKQVAYGLNFLEAFSTDALKENLLEITFWPGESSIYPHDIKGDILAVTAVTKYNDALQLETTPATTVVINPTTPERQKQQPTHPDSENWQQERSHNETQGLLQSQNYSVGKHPKIHSLTGSTAWQKYSVNATLADKTSTAEAVSFDEAMREFINMTCEEKVLTHRHYDQRTIPETMQSIIDSPRIMSVNVKQDLTLVVNSVRMPPIAEGPSATAPFPPKMTSATPSKPCGKSTSSKRREKEA